MGNNRPESYTNAPPDKAAKKSRWIFTIAGVATLAVIALAFLLSEGNTIENVMTVSKRNPGPLTGNINGHQWVDLGLPSGVKWATCNVGATAPEEFGDYYAWGETSPKDDYSPETSLYHRIPFASLVKSGVTDPNGNLTMKHDIANISWGGSWRMPTDEEFQELVDLCDWEFTNYNGINGYMVTGSNKETIFIVAAGYRINTELEHTDEYGDYWSSSVVKDRSGAACSLGYSPKSYGRRCYHRFRGRSIRPVTD